LDDRRAFLSRPKRLRSAAIFELALTYSTAVFAGDSEHQLRDALAALAGDFAKARALPLPCEHQALLAASAIHGGSE
jgi:hypothetical protein